MKYLSLIVFFTVIHYPSFADQSIAPYILDGSFVMYFSSMKQADQFWSFTLQKTQGVEYSNYMSRLEFRISEKMTTNIFTQKGAESFGIDYEGPTAYVQLLNGLSYMIFKISNINLLRTRLESLPTPMPYRIEQNYIILSSSREILDYYNFQGIDKLPEFNKIAQQIKFDWNKNLIWMDSLYMQSKILSQKFFFPMGDRIAGVFNVINSKQIAFDFFTIYNDPRVNQFLSESTRVSPIQTMTLLDFESGKPALIGHSYMNFSGFLKMIQQIDSTDFLAVNEILKMFQNNGINIQDTLLPYIRGRISYTVRAFDLLRKKFDFTISAEISDRQRATEALKEIARVAQNKGLTVKFKDLFTQQFYSWDLGDITMWAGVVEGYLIVSSDETSLVNYVQNIYQARRGFLRLLPNTIQRLIQNKAVGGQIYMRNPEFIQNFNFMNSISEFEFLLSLKDFEWNYYFVDDNGVVGRRDIFLLNFN